MEKPHPEGHGDALIEAIPAYIWTALPGGAVDFFNERCLTYSGRSLESLLGWKWQSILHPDDVGAFVSDWRASVTSGEPLEREIRVGRADGEYNRWLIRNQPKRDETGRIVKWYGVGFDIEDRKRADEVIRQREDAIRNRTEKELRDVIDDIPVLCAGIWPDGRVEFFNRQTLDYYGLPAEKMVDLNWKSVVHPDDLPGHLVKMHTALSTGQPLDSETRTRRADGEYRWLLHRIVPKYDEKGEVVKFYGTSFDIEDRKRAEEAVLEQRVLERTRIARELHDTLLQNFQGTLLLLQTATNLLDEGQAKEQVGRALERAERAIFEARGTIRGLRLGLTQADDLATTLRMLGEDLAASDRIHNSVDFQLHVQGAPLILRPSVRHEVFNIGSEALRNAFRHAGAKHIQLELRYSGEAFQLAVIDDGNGIDASVLAKGGAEGHFGLSGMHERAKIISGDLTLFAEPDRGTKVELRLTAEHAYDSA
ncbi:MAG: PAS domain-containing protein [Bryobacteraceae bacterium]